MTRIIPDQFRTKYHRCFLSFCASQSYWFSRFQHLKNTLASGEATFLHYKELSRRMIENKIILEKKIPETEKDIVNFTSTYDNLRAETERKDKW